MARPRPEPKQNPAPGGCLFSTRQSGSEVRERGDFGEENCLGKGGVDKAKRGKKDAQKQMGGIPWCLECFQLLFPVFLWVLRASEGGKNPWCLGWFSLALPKTPIGDRKGTPKNMCDKDFAELSGELSGSRIVSKRLFYRVMTSNPLELFRKFFGTVRAILWLIFWPLNQGTFKGRSVRSGQDLYSQGRPVRRTEGPATGTGPPFNCTKSLLILHPFLLRFSLSWSTRVSNQQ